MAYTAHLTIDDLPATSVWMAGTDASKGNSLDGALKTEVLVVGAGLAGVLTAWRLKQAGVPCVVVEANSVGSGASGNTTAKITAQHGLIYADLIKRFGTELAQMYYSSNTRAIEAFRDLAGLYPIDLEDRTAYVYSINDRKKLEREADAYRKLGIKGGIGSAGDLPFATKGAVAMENQAQFNPAKLLAALVPGLTIYEQTIVNRVEEGVAYTDKGIISAKHIVLATHYPMKNIPGLYFLKLYQHRSYVLAFEGAPLVSGMYVDERQNGHSFRTYGDLLIIGGGDHRTGKKGGGYDELAGLASRCYPKAGIKYRWAAQDCMTLDSVPYIGRLLSGSKGLYVASGFNKWGMTGSMVASELISDLVIKGKSELELLYSPQRSMWTGQLARNTGEAVAGLASIGAPRCTHMGCKLHKNSAEGTWDCCCHGSRFDQAGKVLDNPAIKDLEL